MQLGYILRRLVATAPVMLIVAVLVFLMLRLTPGDPAAIIAGDNANAEQVAAIRNRLGLDEPIFTQFFIWLGNILRGDFGKSFFFKKTVAELIASRLEPTLALSIATIIHRGLRRGAARRARRLQAGHADRQGRDGLFGARLLGAGVRDRLFADLPVRHQAQLAARCRAISASATASAASCSG